MSFFDRISRAIQKRWSRYGCGPKTFILNVHHWHWLVSEIYKERGYYPEGWHTGEMQFMGTKLVMRNE